MSGTLFKNRGFISSGFLNLTAREAYNEATENNAIIVDVRETVLTGYKQFDVPVVINIPFSTLMESYEKIPQEIPVIIADSVGLHSHQAMDFLIGKGFKSIANLAGGIVDWERDGLPLKKDIAEQLDGSCACQLKKRHKKPKSDLPENKIYKKILILCTGNSCRSQMAQGFLLALNKNLIVCSAGTNPSDRINEKAVTVMKEVGIDISSFKPKSVDLYLKERWDYVITVCDDANEKCPLFTGEVAHRIHIGFDDPAKATGSEEFVLNEFRRIRDEIRKKFNDLFVSQIKRNP